MAKVAEQTCFFHGKLTGKRLTSSIYEAQEMIYYPRESEEKLDSAQMKLSI